MTPEEAASFRTIYAKWPTDRLARAATLEKGEYQPAAVALMLEELKGRELTSGDVEKAATSVPPPMPGILPERDTWLFPARLDRRRYAIRTAVFFCAVVLAAIALEFVPGMQPESFGILMLVSFVYIGLGLLLPRSKDAGFSRGLAILFALIPLSAAITFVMLFFAPSK